MVQAVLEYLRFFGFHLTSILLLLSHLQEPVLLRLLRLGGRSVQRQLGVEKRRAGRAGRLDGGHRAGNAKHPRSVTQCQGKGGLNTSRECTAPRV